MRPRYTRKYKFECPTTMDKFKEIASREMRVPVEEVWKDEEGTKITIEIVLDRALQDEIMYCATQDNIDDLEWFL
jgi:hypothetical protein